MYLFQLNKINMKFFFLTQIILLVCCFLGVYMTTFLTNSRNKKHNEFNLIKNLSENPNSFINQDTINDINIFPNPLQVKKKIENQNPLLNSLNITKERINNARLTLNNLEKNKILLDEYDEEYAGNIDDNIVDDNDVLSGINSYGDSGYKNFCHFNNDKKLITCVAKNHNYKNIFKMCNLANPKFVINENLIKLFNLYNKKKKDKIYDNVLVKKTINPFYVFYTFKKDKDKTTEQMNSALYTASTIIHEKKYDDSISAKIMLHEIFMIVNIFENFVNEKLHLLNLLEYNKLFCVRGFYKEYNFPGLIMKNYGNSTIEYKIIMFKQRVKMKF